jgi:hypothetical protein
MVLEYLDRDVSFNEIDKMAKEKHKNNLSFASYAASQ